eukprot:scaffold14035_cov172-Amphora_coffeaeformis.AAC.8
MSCVPKCQLRILCSRILLLEWYGSGVISTMMCSARLTVFALPECTVRVRYSSVTMPSSSLAGIACSDARDGRPTT